MAQATFDPGNTHADITLTGSDLVAENTDTPGGNGSAATAGNHAPWSTGKYYFEIVYDDVVGSNSFRNGVGIIQDTADIPGNNQGLGNFSNGYAYAATGEKVNNVSNSSYGNSYTDGDVIGVAFDRTNGTLWFSKNGTWQNGAVISDVENHTNTGNAAYTGLTSGSFLLGATLGVDSGLTSNCTLRTTEAAMTGTVPTGFTADIDKATNDGAVSLGLGADGTGSVQPIHGDGSVGAGLGASGAGSLAIRGNGTVGQALGVDGTGDVQPNRGNGGVATGLGVDGAGTVSPIRGNVAVGVGVNASGAGTISIRANGDVSPRMNGVGTGIISPIHGDAVVGVGANAAGTSTVFPKFRGAFDLHLPTISGTQLNGLVLTGEVTLRLPEVAAEAVSGNAISGSITLPSVEAVGYGAPNAAFNLPSLTASGAGVTGEILNLNSTLAKMQASGSFSLDGFYTGGGDLPRINTNGFLSKGDIANADIILRKLLTASVGLTGEVANAAATLPKLTSTGQIVADGELVAAIKLPPIRIEGVIENGATFSTTAWAMNTEHFGTTNYLNYDFHTLGQIGDTPVGITATGIYLLSGDDDAGAAIDAEFQFGFDDFGTEFEKNVPNVYVGYTADNNMVLLTNVDGQGRQRENDVTHKAHQSGLTRARVTLGKGVKSKYWQIGMRNCNGGDFEIDELGALFRELARKV